MSFASDVSRRTNRPRDQSTDNDGKRVLDSSAVRNDGAGAWDLVGFSIDWIVDNETLLHLPPIFLFRIPAGSG